MQKNVPHARASVFWQEIDEDKKADFKRAFPGVDFYDTQFDISSTKIKRISSKTLLWSYAATVLEDENICFLDVDMLVLQDIGGFFDQDFDILFTDKKDEFFPLNTGVMLTRGDARKVFFKQWLEKTIEILENKKLLQKATSLEYPFGGADQMAFYNLISYEKTKAHFETVLDGRTVRVKAVACSVLNETRSTMITNDTHIVHYKGGWQMILLEGKGFTKHRTKKNSWQMYMLYLKLYLEALSFLNEKTGKGYVPRSLGIRIPFYLNPKTLKENKLLYAFFAAIKFVESFFDAIKFRLQSLK